MNPTEEQTTPQQQAGADLPITPELLVELMHLPPGTRIFGARYDEATRTVVLTVSHPDVSSARVLPRYERAWDTTEVTFVGWGQEGEPDQIAWTHVRMS